MELDRLLAAIDHDRGKDDLYSVGDLVNKGPDSAGVLERMIELDAQSVLGNHDKLWLDRGKIASKRLRDWLAAQPVARVLADVVVIHAGIHPKWRTKDLRALEGEAIDFAINVRYCTESGARPASDWPPPGPPFRPWDDFYTGKRRVVFGHWARRGLARTERVVGLDTGCVYGQKLSAWIAEEDRIVQVDGWRGG